jgi:hypothetical protein
MFKEVKFKEVKKQLDLDGKTESDVLIVTFDDDITSIVPKDINNTHYAEIKRQVDAGELTIEEAD